MAVTILNPDVVTYLPADGIAIEIARSEAAHADAVAFLQEDAANVVSVEEFVRGPVPVERDVLDDDVRNAHAVDQGEERRGGRTLLDPEVLHEHLVELEAVPAAGNQGAF